MRMITDELRDVKDENEKLKAIIKKIQDALRTEESGEALVEVARNAHKAEMELASLYNMHGGPEDD